MPLLLDTHAFLWFITEDRRLSQTALQEISASKNEVLLSIASLWEIAIKTSIGKLSLERPFAQMFPAQLQSNRIALLPISVEALAVNADLPWHHRDPFDRLLIAQAMTQRLPLVTRDPAFLSYPVEVLWS